MYIFATGGTPAGVVRYLRAEWKKTLLLMVPAAIYNFQQMLEYVALKNLNPALFSVLVQTKLVTTAIFRASLMGMRLRRSQVVSLLLLMTGVMLAQLHKSKGNEPQSESPTTGVAATVAIALFSGFASVYTEKVIKMHTAVERKDVPHGLAYMQVQLASTSLLIGGTWALMADGDAIMQRVLWDGFDWKALLAAVNSTAGGLTVAAVLKYADAVLKGYATAISVLLTGVLSMVLFGTELSVEYALGMSNVLVAVFLYNAQDLEKHAW